MDAQTLKQKIVSEQITDDEITKLIENSNKHSHVKTNFFKNLIKGYTDAVTIPNLWKSVLELFLILVVIICSVILSYVGKMDTTITAVLFAAVLGFIFGKLR